MCVDSSVLPNGTDNAVGREVVGYACHRMGGNQVGGFCSLPSRDLCV